MQIWCSRVLCIYGPLLSHLRVRKIFILMI